jgi:hypothetical protein
MYIHVRIADKEKIFKYKSQGRKGKKEFSTKQKKVKLMGSKCKLAAK